MSSIRKSRYGGKAGRAAIWLTAILAGSFASAVQGDTEASIKRISLEEFRKLLSARAIVAVDVRSLDAYVLGHIPGAISVPLDAVASRAAELRRLRKPIVTYCA